MKQFKLINAYDATEQLSKNATFSASTLWAIYQLRKQLYPHHEFQNEQEEVLRQKYMQFADEEGRITGKSYNDYVKEINELANLEKEITITEKIPIVLTDNMGITVEAMEALEDFVEFKTE